MSNLVEDAKKILLNNRRAGFTLPTNNKLYPAQWNWDSAFISLGYSYFNLDYAIEELETLLKGQWDDGMVPHILFHEVDDSYFPNHTTWSCGKKIPSSGELISTIGMGTWLTFDIGYNTKKLKQRAQILKIFF